ncbi:GNAT family N-acetyltransferase [Streptomyces pinistramenti]|uniref:GNAT family N-acetyltransferase n=1 Tax=Streptomyces pinistramenti TaxID=2884812 RepID=UPI001D076C0A|nr:GNAT family N-acetyltransferase [Streptomyces pinistramenti]MCB5907399.1 GNAT family N-acetyltransferase [Streptomyces pinistramenti]
MDQGLVDERQERDGAGEAPGSRGLEGRTALRCADGPAVVSFLAGEWRGHPRATSVRVEAGTPGEAAALLLRELPDWLVVTDDSLAAELAAAGATVQRRAHRYGWDLSLNPPDPAWLHPPLALRPAAETPVDSLRELWLAAYAHGHPDRARYERAEDGLAVLASLWQGELLGPVLPFSAVVVDDQGPAAALAVHALESPWITQIFRDPAPRGRGLGSALIRYALAAAATNGLHRLGASVTTDNVRSGRMFTRVGFRRLGDSVDLRLPAAPEHPAYPT